MPLWVKCRSSNTRSCDGNALKARESVHAIHGPAAHWCTQAKLSMQPKSCPGLHVWPPEGCSQEKPVCGCNQSYPLPVPRRVRQDHHKQWDTACKASAGACASWRLASPPTPGACTFIYIHTSVPALYTVQIHSGKISLKWKMCVWNLWNGSFPSKHKQGGQTGEGGRPVPHRNTTAVGCRMASCLIPCLHASSTRSHIQQFPSFISNHWSKIFLYPVKRF